MKKFKNEEEWAKAVNEIEWQSRVYTPTSIELFRQTIKDVKHSTQALEDALFLLKLLNEKIEAHNGICKQKAGQMKQTSYKRNNIEDWS